MYIQDDKKLIIYTRCIAEDYIWYQARSSFQNKQNSNPIDLSQTLI